MILDPVQTVEGENLVKAVRKDLARLDDIHEVHLFEVEAFVVGLVAHFGVLDHFAGDIDARDASEPIQAAQTIRKRKSSVSRSSPSIARSLKVRPLHFVAKMTAP